MAPEPGAAGGTGAGTWVQLVVAVLGAGGLGSLATWMNGRTTERRQERQSSASQASSDFVAVNAAARETITALRSEAVHVRDLLREAERRVGEVDEEHRKEIQVRDIAFEEAMSRYRLLVQEHDRLSRNYLRALQALAAAGVAFTPQP